MVLVVVGTSGLFVGFGPLIVGSQCCWSHCDWHYQGGTQQSRIQETGHGLSPGANGAIVAPNSRQRL
jgi:hypothetical protein